MAELVRGERYDTKGYQLVAVIDNAEEDGGVIVCHNNSSHYLVFTRGHDEMLDDELRYGVFEQSWSYFKATEEECRSIYREVLEFAVALAVSR